LDSGEDVGEALDFAAPAALACLLDLFEQSGMGALQSWFRAGVWPGEFALFAGVFVDAAGAVARWGKCRRSCRCGCAVPSSPPWNRSATLLDVRAASARAEAIQVEARELIALLHGEVA